MAILEAFFLLEKLCDKINDLRDYHIIVVANDFTLSKLWTIPSHYDVLRFALKVC